MINKNYQNKHHKHFIVNMALGVYRSIKPSAINEYHSTDSNTTQSYSGDANCVTAPSVPLVLVQLILKPLRY